MWKVFPAAAGTLNREDIWMSRIQPSMPSWTTGRLRHQSPEVKSSKDELIN